MRFHVLEKLEMDCRTILIETRLSERVETAFCSVVCEEELEILCLVKSSASENSGKHGSGEEGGEGVVLDERGKSERA